jgi:hypothetical protein
MGYMFMTLSPLCVSRLVVIDSTNNLALLVSLLCALRTHLLCVHITVHCDCTLRSPPPLSLDLPRTQSLMPASSIRVSPRRSCPPPLCTLLASLLGPTSSVCVSPHCGLLRKPLASASSLCTLPHRSLLHASLVLPHTLVTAASKNTNRTNGKRTRLNIANE